MKCIHKEFTFSESGLFVDPSRPYLGASPDLLVHCSCCGMGLSEMKSPFSIVNEIPSAIKSPLRKEHAYYAQIRGQLVALAGRTYCDFFVFTRVGYFTQRINFDKSYWHKLVSNLEFFFKNYVDSELLSH